MGETEKLVKAPENGQHMSLLAKLSSWFTGLKAEFNKIIWPDKQHLQDRQEPLLRRLLF